MNAIDIYIFGYDKFNCGLSANIPGTALAIGGYSTDYSTYLATSHVISHEMGHCLGLYHTFHGLCEGGIAELVNENDCLNRGDFVCDTPADPTYFNVNQNDCTWNGSTCTGSTKDANGDSYHPNTSLYMAYIPPNCMQQHTPGQVERMKAVIENSSILQNVLISTLTPIPITPTITGPSYVCLGSTVTYTVKPALPGYTWSCSSNIVQVYPGNTGSFVFPSSAENGWISINSGSTELARKNIGIGNGISITGPSSIGSATSTVYQADPDCAGNNYMWILYKYNYNTMIGEHPDTCYIRNYATINSVFTSGQTNAYILQVYAGNDIFAEKQIGAGSYTLSLMGLKPGDPNAPILFSISPNPATSEISVEITTDDADSQPVVAVEPSYTVSITDVSGSPAYKGKKKGKKFHLSVSSLKNGVYNVTVSDGEKTGHGKLIVKH